MTAFECLDANTLNLMKASPQNPIVRGLILKNAGVWVPEELTTFEQFEEWLKGNPAIKPAPKTLSVDYSETITVRGRARFTAQENGSATVELTERDLLNLLEHSDSPGDFRERLCELIRERGSDDLSTETDTDSYEYEDHQATETIDSKTDYSMDAAVSGAVEILKSIAPDALKELDPDEEL